MLKNYNLKITDFAPKKRKKLNKDFLSSILLYVHKFFENESKTRPDISKFYLPLPSINISIVELGGRASLQFDLYRREISVSFDNKESQILRNFYENLINLDLIRGNKKRRIISLKKLCKIFFPFEKLDKGHSQICYKDLNNNIIFNHKFTTVFEKYKKLAIFKLIKEYYDSLHIREFELEFPGLKRKILTITKKRDSKLFLTYGFSKECDISYGIGLDFVEYCSRRLYNKNHSKIISDIGKIIIKGTNRVKPHIVKKVSSQLEAFERYKQEQIREFQGSIKVLLNQISYKNISKPFWIKKENLLFYYYRTPHGVWERDPSRYNSIKRNTISRYNICKKIPFPSNLDFIPILGFNKIDKNIYFVSLDDDKKCSLIERFFSIENLNSANEKDREFLRYFGITQNLR